MGFSGFLRYDVTRLKNIRYLTYICSTRGDKVYIGDKAVLRLSIMEHLRKITNLDKVTFALLLEEGKARITELEFHLTLTQMQIKKALTQLVAQGLVVYEASTQHYMLL